MKQSVLFSSQFCRLKGMAPAQAQLRRGPSGPCHFMADDNGGSRGGKGDHISHRKPQRDEVGPSFYSSLSQGLTRVLQEIP